MTTSVSDKKHNFFPPYFFLIYFFYLFVNQKTLYFFLQHYCGLRNCFKSMKNFVCWYQHHILATIVFVWQQTYFLLPPSPPFPLSLLTSTRISLGLVSKKQKGNRRCLSWKFQDSPVCMRVVCVCLLDTFFVCKFRILTQKSNSLY